VHGDKSTAGRVLLAHSLERCQFLYPKVLIMSEVQVPPHPSAQRITLDSHTMVIHYIGHGYPRTFFSSKRSSQIPHCRHRLLYQVDKSRAPNNHHYLTSPKVLLEECHMQAWLTPLLGN